MYNTATVDLIKKIPSVSGFDIERLPQSLTKVYARIISLKTKYEDGTIPFNDLELEKDYHLLVTLANTLEMMLVGNTENPNKQSISYVAATSRKLMGMIRSRQELPLTIDYIPEELYAALLYVISGSLADAKEVADVFPINVLQSRGAKQLMICLEKLISGYLSDLLRFKVIAPEDDEPGSLAEELLWNEMTKGVKSLASYLRDGMDYSGNEFLRVEQLSSYQIDLGTINNHAEEVLFGLSDRELYINSQYDIYTGTLVLSKLLMMAAEELMKHGLIRVTAPVGVNPMDWSDAMKRQITFRPYLWDNHIEAINKGVLNVGMSAVITFPTGAGKTTLSELKIASSLLKGRDIIYLVPTHALETQVYKSMKRLLERLNDPKVKNRDAEFADFDEVDDNPIKVMTPEHCLTMIRVQPESFRGLGLVVFDEFHLMSGNENDNRAIDSMLLMTELLSQHPDADYLLISAMVSNSDDVADWIASATGRCCLNLDNPWKPTSQLQGCVVYNTSQIDAIRQLITITQRNLVGKQITPPQALQKQLMIQPECLFSLKTIWDTMQVADYYHEDILDHAVQLKAARQKDSGKWYLSANYNVVAAELAAKYATIGMKTIIFALDPQAANSINKNLTELLQEDKTDYLRQHHQKKMGIIGLELGGEEFSYLSCSQSATLHHANLLPEERVISEDYFTSKDGVSVMVATPTIAQGINLPADIVLIAGSARFDKSSKSMEQIDAHEILNAAGRAGRAGFRSHGTAILIPSKPISLEKNKINKVWTEIKDEIFSKGDRCLEVEDPLGNIMNLMEYDSTKPLLLKLQDEEKKLRSRMSKSFYAYKMQREGRRELLNHQIDSLIGLLAENRSQNERIAGMAAKTNVDEATIEQLLEMMTQKDAISTLEMDVKELLVWIAELFEDDCILVDKLLGNEFAGVTIRKNLGMKENQAWNKKTVAYLFKLVGAYVNGATLLDIESGLRERKDSYLKNARVFVIKVIPSVSYICGTVIQVLLMWLDRNGVRKEDCPLDMKVFAPCVKEGVLSYDMLMEKYRRHLMRVECHNEYRK